MATQGTAQQLAGIGWSTPEAARTRSAREAAGLPAVLRAVVRLWRGAEQRGQRLEERREQVRREFVTLDPRPW